MIIMVVGLAKQACQSGVNTLASDTQPGFPQIGWLTIRYITMSQPSNEVATRKRPRRPIPRPVSPEGGLSPEGQAAIAAGTPDSTRRAYISDIEAFEDWCAETGHSGLPTNGTVLADYATYLAYTCGHTPGSIERARWAILKWHRLAEVAQPATDGLIAVLKGYRAALAQAKDSRSRIRRAAPATPDRLGRMVSALDLGTAMGLRNRSLLLLGFAIAARRAELASLDISDLAFEDRGVQVSVYRKKVRKQDDPVVMYRDDPAMCPVRATEVWIARLEAEGRGSGPLYVRIDRHDRIAPPLVRNGAQIGDPQGRMSGQGVGDAIRRCALSTGISTTGHGLRRGYVTAAADARMERRLIERQGGWAAGSHVVSAYIEDSERWLYDALDGLL